MSIRKLCKCAQTATFPKRPAGKQRDLPRHLRRAAAKMSKSHRVGLLDLIYFCQKTKIDVATINRDILDQAARRLMATAQKSARARTLAWRRAVDALPDDIKALHGITETMTNPRGKRVLSEPINTFKALEADLAPLIHQATQFPTDICDPHKPVAHKTAKAAANHIMIVAATLYRLGVVGTDVRLIDLLHPDMQARFLEAISDRIDPADADDPQGNGEANEKFDLEDDPARAVEAAKKGVWVGDYMSAVAFFGIRLLGAESDEVLFAQAQGRKGDRSGLTSAQVLQLTELTKPSRLSALRDLPTVLMSYAESATHFSGGKRHAARLRCANLAAALAVQLDLLLHPNQLVTLVCPLEKGDLIIKSLDDTPRTVPWGDLSDLSRNMLDRRQAVRAELGKPSRFLFPSTNLTTPQDMKSVCSSLGKVLAQHGFPKVTMQVLRDVGAVALLRADRKKLRRVMILLGLKTVRSVYRRFAAFLKGV